VTKIEKSPANPLWDLIVHKRLNLEGRLDDLRGGSNGFSSNMKLNGATVNLEGQGNAEGKGSKSPVEPALQHGPENR
jgi:hypothetical protein